MKTDKLSAAYVAWCLARNITPSADTLKKFHESKDCPAHDRCNFCNRGAMA